MPVAGRIPPPRDCPVCRERVWSREDTRDVFEAWQRYNVHVHTTHPEYERWNRRMSWNYLIALLPFVGGAVASTQVTPIDVAGLFNVLSLVLAFAVFATVFVAKQRGRSRFRELWNEEHGGSVKPM